MTLAEMVIASTVSAILLLAVVDIFAFAMRQWSVRTGEATAIQSGNLAAEGVEKDLRTAISLSVQYTAGGAKSGNPIFTATLPKTTDAAGNYIPERSSTGTLRFGSGKQVGYYLSNTSGKTAIRNGNVLWRATRGAGQTSLSSWKPDADWSLYENGAPRFSNIRQFSIEKDGAVPNLVLMTLALSETDDPVGRARTITRHIYLANNDTSLGNG